VRQSAAKLIRGAVQPLSEPRLREKILDLYAKADQVIDSVSADELMEAGFNAESLEQARGLVQSFEQFISDHKDEITVLQILYSRPTSSGSPTRT